MHWIGYRVSNPGLNYFISSSKTSKKACTRALVLSHTRTHTWVNIFTSMCCRRVRECWDPQSATPGHTGTWCRRVHGWSTLVAPAGEETKSRMTRTEAHKCCVILASKGLTDFVLVIFPAWLLFLIQKYSLNDVCANIRTNHQWTTAILK